MAQLKLIEASCVSAPVSLFTEMVTRGLPLPPYVVLVKLSDVKPIKEQSGVGVMVGVRVFVGVEVMVGVGVATMMNVFDTTMDVRPSTPYAWAKIVYVPGTRAQYDILASIVLQVVDVPPKAQ
jgi:hypothetical protein